MKDENWGVVVALVMILGLGYFAILGALAKNGTDVARATETPAASATAERATIKVAPTRTLPAGLEVTGEEVVTFTYRLDERGGRVWSEAGRIPKGRLIKVQGCVEGFRQVEYQPDLERPGFWRVEWARCGTD